MRSLLFGGAALAIWGMIVAVMVARLEPKRHWWQWAEFRGHVPAYDHAPMHVWAMRLPAIWISSHIHPVEVPRLTIDIKFKHMRRLWHQRNEAIAIGQLEQGPDDYVPATIRLDDRSVRVRLRLKGDVLEDYVLGGRWGFRIHVKGKDQVLGMRRFSLHHPHARFYHGQVLFNTMVRHYGLLAPRYLFVDLTLNGDFLGRYALEEHFSKELLESQGRRESVIIKFDENRLWEARRIRQDPGGELWKNFGHAKIVPFRQASISKSPRLQRDLEVAIGLARAFAQDSVPPSAVFDATLMGRFIAISEAWSAGHGIEWRNMRFYFNPITARLEPIAYDSGMDNMRTPTQSYNHRDRFLQQLLADPAIEQAYLATLQDLIEVMSDTSRYDYLLQAQGQALATLRGQYPFVSPFPLEQLASRARELLDFETGRKEPTGMDANHVLHAYLVETPSGHELQLASGDTSQVVIKRMFWLASDGTEAGPLVFSNGREPAYPLHIRGTPHWKALEFTTLRYRMPTDSNGAVLILLAGQPRRQTYRVQAEKYLPVLAHGPLPQATPRPLLARLPFLQWDDTGHTAIVSRGTWRIDHPLVLPSGVGLTIEPGTTLEFAPSAFVLVNGPTTFVGSAANPIVLSGQGGLPWRGIAVMSPRPILLTDTTRSSWSYITIRNTSGVRHEGWALSGGITFYRTEVRLDHVTVEGSTADDAVNLVHSPFVVRALTLREAESDGVDSDFSDGTISGSAFSHIGRGGGGDGLDISGSRVTVDSSRFDHIEDKALSVGEGSTMTASALAIDRVGAGAAVKDGSCLTLSDSHLSAISNAGLMAYIKKPEYGPGRVTARNVIIEDTERPVWVQIGNQVTLDGVRAPTESVNVDSLYQTAMKKKRHP